MGPGLLEGSERTARCVVVRCDQRLYELVERWPLKEGGWEGTSIDAANWLDDIHE